MALNIVEKHLFGAVLSNNKYYKYEFDKDYNCEYLKILTLDCIKDDIIFADAIIQAITEVRNGNGDRIIIRESECTTEDRIYCRTTIIDVVLYLDRNIGDAFRTETIDRYKNSCAMYFIDIGGSVLFEDFNVGTHYSDYEISSLKFSTEKEASDFASNLRKMIFKTAEVYCDYKNRFDSIVREDTYEDILYLCPYELSDDILKIINCNDGHYELKVTEEEFMHHYELNQEIEVVKIFLEDGND